MTMPVTPVIRVALTCGCTFYRSTKGFDRHPGDAVWCHEHPNPDQLESDQVFVAAVEEVPMIDPAATDEPRDEVPATDLAAVEAAARALLHKIERMTSEEFSRGGERGERLALRHALGLAEDGCREDEQCPACGAICEEEGHRPPCVAVPCIICGAGPTEEVGIPSRTEPGTFLYSEFRCEAHR